MNGEWSRLKRQSRSLASEQVTSMGAVRGTALDCMRGLPLPALVLDEGAKVVLENPAYRARFGAGQAGEELGVALLGGRDSAIRAAMRGVSRVVPLGTIGGVPLDAHYFPLGAASGKATHVGILLVAVRERVVSTPPQQDAAGAGARASSDEVEQTLRFVLDGMPQLVWSTRPDGYHDFYNRRWYEYTGADPNVTRGGGWNDELHPDDQQRAWERWKRSLETGEDYEIEYRFRRGDGAYRWFLGRALPMRDESGRIVRWFGTCTDIDDQKRLEQQRAEVLAQAEATSRMKDEFLAIVSHELRTPLTAILGWARLQRDRPELLPKAMTVIERNAEAQAKLIEEILETSRIVTGKVRLSRRLADLGDIVQAAVDTIRPAAENKTIHLEVSLGSAPVPIDCDPDRLQQVVLNLLVNAVKFTPDGGRVQVRIELAEPLARVVVADTGGGISSSFLAHVFDPFRQAESSTTRQHGGLGLGLAITKHLVELHGGTVTAASQGLGKGATFVVTLPLAAETERAGSYKRAVRAAVEAAPRPSGLDGIRVLVVDDEGDARELVTMLLREAGAETVEACSASSALAAIERSPPDVLVSDIGMPVEDGYALLRKLRMRAPEAGGKVPAIALTAFTRGEDVARSREAGFARHLAKPVEPAELVDAVRQLASGSRLHAP
jgi:PAS domain S-box-containing protein